MSNSLEDILNGTSTQAISEPQAAVTADPVSSEPSPAPATTEAATGAPEPQAQAVPPTANDDSLDKKISAFQRKAEDETRKRQDYERQLQEARTALAERDRQIEAERQRVQQLAAQQQSEIDLYDPQQAQNFVSQIVAENLLVQKVITSQEMMRDANPDYDEMEAIFAEEMEKNPGLQQQMFAAPFPAKFAYNHAKKVKALRDIGDPAEYRERMRQELLAELQAQQPEPAPAPAQTVQTPAKPVPQPPKTLAGVPSAARDAVKHPWKGPTPLDQLLS